MKQRATVRRRRSMLILPRLIVLGVLGYLQANPRFLSRLPAHPPADFAIHVQSTTVLAESETEFILSRTTCSYRETTQGRTMIILCHTTPEQFDALYNSMYVNAADTLTRIDLPISCNHHTDVIPSEGEFSITANGMHYSLPSAACGSFILGDQRLSTITTALLNFLDLAKATTPADYVLYYRQDASNEEIKTFRARSFVIIMELSGTHFQPRSWIATRGSLFTYDPRLQQIVCI